MNDPFVHAQAKQFADAAAGASGRTTPARIERAYLLLFGRPPTADETTAATRVPGDGARRSCGTASVRRTSVGEGVGEPRPGAVPEQRVRVRGLSPTPAVAIGSTLRVTDARLHVTTLLAAPSSARWSAGRSLLPGILSRAARRRRARRRRSARAEEAALRAEGEARHLPVLTGGVSHMDTFDPKPKLFAADGKTLGVGGGLSLEQDAAASSRGGSSSPAASAARMVSDLFPHLREQMDDICLIRSMTTDNNEHFQATLAIHTGSFFFARPSLGSWVSYGLGTVNQNLPSFVVIAPHLPYAGTQVFGQRLPARLPPGHARRARQGADPQRQAAGRRRPTCRSWSSAWPRRSTSGHLKQHGNDTDLAARIRTFETAFRMQSRPRRRSTCRRRPTRRSSCTA